MIAICVPSRGLIFTRTMDSVIQGMQALNKIGIATKFFTTWDLPIPDGHNATVELALQDPAVQKVIFIEEDMYISPEAFTLLATCDHQMATYQYNDKNGRPHGIIEFDEEGEVVWCGLGATMITRQLFEKVGKPYFNTKRRWKITRELDPKKGKFVRSYEPLPHEAIDQYGGLDVDFCFRVRKLGERIVCLKEHKAAHFQLLALGEPHRNNGCHEIRTV